MKIKNIDIIFESFKDAKVKFKDEASSNEVDKYIEIFKKLAQKNIIKGSDKDIGKWIKSGWQEFKTFVDNKSIEKTNTEVKKSKKKDSITVYEDDDKMIVIPLSKDASCYYGKNTKWCTAASRSGNMFVQYFYSDGVTLFYILSKGGKKYAASYRGIPNSFELFDDEDKLISKEEFENTTKVKLSDIEKYYKKYYEIIENHRNINNSSENDQIELLKLHPENIKKIKNPTERVQLEAVKQNTILIRHIENPTERIQMEVVKSMPHMLMTLIKKGVKPSESVLLAAISREGNLIRLVDDPSEDLQLAAVKNEKSAIEHIDNPSELIQLTASSHKAEFTNIIRNIIEKGERKPELEHLIAKDPMMSIKYAIQILKGPFPEAEDNIAKSSVFSIPYAKRVLNDRFEKGEDSILGSYDLNMIKEYMDFMKEKGYGNVANKFKEHYDKVKEELGE